MDIASPQTNAPTSTTAWPELEGKPWLDFLDADIEGYVRSIPEARRPKSFDLEQKLKEWHRNGYVIFRGAIDPAQIDAYLADMQQVIDDPGAYHVLTQSAKFNQAIEPTSKFTREELLNEKDLRLTNFTFASRAGRVLSLNETVVTFLEHVFRDHVCAMQSLTFIRGSQQPMHQDFAYVNYQTIIPHLTASWIALEDGHPDSGPLGYFPGSQWLRKFDFGNGWLFTPERARDPMQFAKYREDECARLGIAHETFIPKKGDVLVWHGSLAHEGTRVKNPELTRKSFVTHYTSLKSWPEERKVPKDAPCGYFELNGGYFYTPPHLSYQQDLFPRGLRFRSKREYGQSC